MLNRFDTIYDYGKLTIQSLLIHSKWLNCDSWGFVNKTALFLNGSNVTTTGYPAQKQSGVVCSWCRK